MHHNQQLERKTKKYFFIIAITQTSTQITMVLIMQVVYIHNIQTAEDASYIILSGMQCMYPRCVSSARAIQYIHEL